MNLPLTFICVMILSLEPLHGCMGQRLIPDSSIMINVNQTTPNSTAIGKCVAASKTSSMNVRLQTFKTKANTTFVRRLAEDGFLACYAGLERQLNAKSFFACSVATEKAGLKMFQFKDPACTGYPFIITQEQLGPGCWGSGSNALYVIPPGTVKASRLSEPGRSPASRGAQATSRIRLTVSTDKIVDDDGFKGIDGKGLASSQAYKELDVLNKCQCHHICSRDSACNAYSVLTRSPTSARCHLAKANVYTNTPSSVSGSYYAVRAALVDPHSIDNLIYKRLTTAAQGYAAHKAACEAIPGFRLVAVRFQAQMAILQKICLDREPTSPTESCRDTTNTKYFYVDMIKMAGGPMIQGVIPLTETDLAASSVLVNDVTSVDHFIYAHTNQLHDESATKYNTKPVCQANVYGVNW